MPAAASGSSDPIDLTDFAEGLFHGAASHLAERFTLNPAAGDLASTGYNCADLLDPSSLYKILENYSASRFPESDRRSAASMWAQWYFGFLLPPLFLLSAAADCEVPHDPADLRVWLDPQHQPRQFVLTNEQAFAAPEEASPFERTRNFFEGHLAPLVFSLSARSGVSAKVFWMSAAVIIDYTSDVFLKPGETSFKPLTQERLLPNGERNPLFGPYRPSGSEATRTRRVCCMRYNLEGIERCPDCPLKPKAPKTRKNRPGLITDEAAE